MKRPNPDEYRLFGYTLFGSSEPLLTESLRQMRLNLGYLLEEEPLFVERAIQVAHAVRLAAAVARDVTRALQATDATIGRSAFPYSVLLGRQAGDWVPVAVFENYKTGEQVWRAAWAF